MPEFFVQPVGDLWSGPSRDIGDLNTIVVHRSGWHSIELFEDNGAEPHPLSMAQYYLRRAGIVYPYTFTVGFHGQVWQSHNITDKTAHAGSFNLAGIGVAVIGDFRFSPPAKQQRRALLELCCHLKRWRELRVMGHMPELGPSASSDPNKQCPGALLNMDDLRRDINRTLESNAASELNRLGVVF